MPEIEGSLNRQKKSQTDLMGDDEGNLNLYRFIYLEISISICLKVLIQ